jgi:hypothetical protein
VFIKERGVCDNATWHELVINSKYVDKVLEADLDQIAEAYNSCDSVDNITVKILINSFIGIQIFRYQLLLYSARNIKKSSHIATF